MALSDEVTAAMIAQLRRMIDEPDDTIYDDDALTTYIAEYPVLDERGEEPYTWDTSTTPPTRELNDSWIAEFCLHSAAADIWEEKAAAVGAEFDFSSADQRFSRSQKHQHYMQQARWHRARRKARTITQVVHPEVDAEQVLEWVVNS